MTFKRRMAAVAAGLSLTALFAFTAGPAQATNESATIGLKMDPLSGSLSKDSFKPVNWQVETKIETPDATIQPMKQANLSLPGGSLTFNPDPKMPVCPDNKIGPGLVSVPVEQAIAACPKSIIGNGLAKFALGQQTSASRDGVMLVYNGGLEKSGTLKGRPRIKVYAYSYDTGVGVYAEAALSKSGELNFAIPQLTADSSVTSLNLNIPGKKTDLFVASKGITVTLPPGQDKSYAQARCANGSWPFGAQFLLGDRDTSGQPIGQTTTLDEKGVAKCKGGGSGGGGAKFAGLKIKGPGSVKAGGSGTYKVTVKNTGKAKSKAGKVTVSGKGAKGKASFKALAPGKSANVKVKVKFSTKGTVKAKFKASAGSATKTKVKTVKVK